LQKKLNVSRIGQLKGGAFTPPFMSSAQFRPRLSKLCGVRKEFYANLIPEGPASPRAMINIIVQAQRENFRNTNHHASFDASATIGHIDAQSSSVSSTDAPPLIMP
jgi:hypothetical protein